MGSAHASLLRGRVTILFITHRIPRGLEVDEVVNIGLSAAPTNHVAREEG